MYNAAMSRPASGNKFQDEGLFLVVYLLVLFVIPLVYRRWRFRVSRSWPLAEATIHVGDVRQEGKEQRWVVRVSYTFHTVKGDRHGGSFAHGVRGPEEGQAYLAKVQGTKIPVRYKAWNPDDSIADQPE